MAALQEIMTDLKKLFDKFAAEEGSKDTLSKKQLNALLAKEDFGKMGMGTDEIMEGLDENEDGVVDFKEFVGLLAAYMYMTVTK